MGLLEGNCLGEYEVPDFVDGPDGIDQMKQKRNNGMGYR